MKDTILNLTEISIGQNALVVNLNCTGLSKQRMLDLGIVPNTIIHVLRKSPWGDPTAYIIRDTCIALRKEEASKILVKKID